MSNETKNIIKLILIAAVLVTCFYFGKIFQPKSKAIKIYSAALEDYNNKNYSNSFYLFSRINPTSGLKPAALYYQAQCARLLGDKNSEKNSYRTLVRYYPNTQLGLEAKYRLGQILLQSEPNESKKYFNDVLAKHSQQDYKIAAQYYIARINSQSSSDMDKKEIEQSFRNYLEKYPDGRLANEVIKTWQNYNQNISQNDLILIAKSLYKLEDYEQAQKTISNTDLKLSWPIVGIIKIAQGQTAQGKSIILDGINENANNVSKNDYNLAIDTYLKSESDYYKATSTLLNKANGKNKDYIWNLKCKYTPKTYKLACYEQLYANFPEGDYAQNSMENIILGRILKQNYSGAKSVADSYILKYPDSDNIDMVMFWRAKIEQKYSHNPNFDIYYKNVINNFPDSYYAYRAFWLSNNLKNSVINTELDYKPIEYPYKYPNKNTLLYNLILVQDYDLIEKLTDDDFIKSWAQYNKGNYMTSVFLAQKAMDKIKHKPPKSDVRWRLIYPLNYYKQIKNYSQNYNNDLALMMSIVREESHFNSYAQSGVGAIGLMQLMPSTAHDIGKNYGLVFNTSNLFNPELNIKLGNIYYSSIKKLAQNQDISAIAAYNGGIGSVVRWKNSLEYSDTDEFVEQIPYDETKDYVKKIFRSYWNYVRIYQH